jgi:predicted DCC family thiol-disulfide oxidoreductase YuxK
VENKPILFYDGDCGFCNRSVQFVLKYQQGNALLFCRLQSNLAKEIITHQHKKQIVLDTVYMVSQGVIYDQSTAFLKLIPYLKWPCYPLFILWIVPAFIRDFGYRVIARRRHRLAGSFCVCPTSAQQHQFIGE